MKLSRQSWSHVIFINSYAYTTLVKLNKNIYPRFWFIEIKNNWCETNERVLYLKLSQYHNKDETVYYIDENFHETLICERSRNRKIFLTILRNLQFLSCQGLAFRGNNNEGNFEQLM